MPETCITIVRCFVNNTCIYRYIFILVCKENVNQSFGRLDISYTSEFDPYCKWIVGNAGIHQAVAIVSIQQMNISHYSRYVAVVALLFYAGFHRA